MEKTNCATINNDFLEKSDDNNDFIQIIPLGDRMKCHELVYDITIPKDHYYCIRLDGHGFSKFTKNLHKPYDENFSKAMILSAYDTMCEFNARSAYTQSDEITLIFDISDSKNFQCHFYNGRVQKLVSLSASFVSTKFNYYLKIFIENYIKTNPGQQIYKSEIVEQINKCLAYFDARILSFSSDSKNEILNHLIWRSCGDCYWNAIQTYASTIFGEKTIENFNGQQIISLMEKNNFSWDKDVALWQKYGVFIKKKLTNIETINGPTIHSKMVALSFKIFFSENLLDFFLSYYYHEHKLENIMVEYYDIESYI